MITREMTIEEIFTTHPHKSQRLAQEMANAGLNCVGCSASTIETLEQGMRSHGMDEKEIESLLKRLNLILEEETDASTISMTERAVNKFKAILKAEGKEDWALRFGDQKGGCSGREYVLDYSKKALEDDEIFTSFGIEIHVNRESVSRLLGSEIDYQDGLKGAGFKITNPNVKKSCSCGSSQSY